MKARRIQSVAVAFLLAIGIASCGHSMTSNEDGPGSRRAAGPANTGGRAGSMKQSATGGGAALPGHRRKPSNEPSWRSTRLAAALGLPIYPQG